MDVKTAEMILWVKCSLHKLMDLIPDAQHSGKKCAISVSDFLMLILAK